METNFLNITITIEALSPKTAYAKLCEILEPLSQKNELNYMTDSFTTSDDPDNVERDTSELFPDQEED